jgi:pimeloyl-ACP methyl ester carboxylesterase
MPVAPCGDLKISYDDAGSGEPALLCMPGWCAGRGAFDVFSAKTAKHRRTLALDWRGHGGSSRPSGDFGAGDLVQDALAVINASGARSIVPVATAHAGWEAIELRRRIPERIPRIVFVDWIITEAPPPFLAGLKAMQDTKQALGVRDTLFAMWTEGVTHPEVLRFVREDMGSYPAEMWARAGREIAAAYAREGSPLKALAALNPPVPSLHLYLQPADPGFLEMQENFARTHPWFSVRRLEGRSHFPTIEVPDQVAAAVERFVTAA